MADRIIKSEREILNRTYVDETETLKVAIHDISTDDIQNPLPIDGDSIYQKDIDTERSNIYNFSGEVVDLFNNLHTENICSTAVNPKMILIHFKRTFILNALGLGSSEGGTFSNVKIILITSGGVEILVFDDSANNTDLTTITARFSAMIGGRLTSVFPANAIRLEFHTTDPIALTNCYIPKVDLNLSFIQAQTIDGEYVDVGASLSGNLKVTDAENGLAIAKGEVSGTTFIHKFGEARNIDTIDGFTDIWDGANNLLSGKIVKYTFSTTNDIDSISSSSLLDTQLVEIQGLDVDYNEVIQTITLDGQNTVILPTPLIRVFRMINRGTIDMIGEVYLYINGAAVVVGVPSLITDVRAIINDGNNQTLMAIYTIPAGKTGYMRDWYASLSRDKVTTCLIHLDARPFGQVFQLKHVTALTSTGTSYIQHKYQEPEIFTEKTDIIMHSNTTTNDSGVAAGFDIVLSDNII